MSVRTAAEPGIEKSGQGQAMPLLDRDGWRAVGALTLLALIVRLIRLDVRGFNIDELHTLKALQRPLGDMVAERLRQGHLPGYFFGLRIWSELFGTSDFSLRMPSVLAGTAVVAVAAWAANGRMRRFPLLAALGLMALNPVAVETSQTARMYSFLALAATAAFGIHLRALEAGEFRSSRPGAGVWWGLWTAVVALGAFIQPLMLLFAGSQIAAQALRPGATRRQRAAAAAIIGALTTAALGGAVATGFYNRGAGDGSFAPAAAMGLAGVLALGEQSRWRFWELVQGAGLILLISAAAFRYGRGRLATQSPRTAGEHGFLKMCLLSALLPFSVFLVLTLFFDAAGGAKRYLSPTTPFLAFLISAAAYPLSRPLKLAVWTMVGASVATGLIGRYKADDSGARTLLAYIARHAKAGDAVVADGYARAFTAVGQYLPPGVERMPIFVPFDAADPGPAVLADLRRSIEQPRLRRLWIFTFRQPDNEIRKAAGRLPEMLTLEKTKKINSAEAFLYRISGR